ncbi:MAG: hypothetical protein R3293_08455 [Candidatus Promineifilaceae bacterium]|nr:hypothetical protein [Candidatus Promineifilaceae bacterium]
MFEIDIPGFSPLAIEHLVCGYHGTLAIDGRLTSSAKDQLNRVARHVSIHVITADTFGTAEHGLRGVKCELQILPEENLAAAKRDLVQRLGNRNTAAIGSGRVDCLMLETAALGIVVLSDEGCATEAIQAADIFCPSISGALSYFEQPRRLMAVLRR